MEAEIVYHKGLDYSVYVYSLRSKNANILPIKDGEPPVCPNCGKIMESYKLVRDVPDRYIDDKGALRCREYKDI
jgi:hypothetical protein